MVSKSDEPIVCGPIAAQIVRFRRTHRTRLVTYAETSKRVAQLSLSHPLLFFALATKYGTAKQRRTATQMTIDGAPLKNVCQVMGIPLCLNRIPPEACVHPVPYASWSGTAGRSLSCAVPEDIEVAAAWLPRVQLAHQWCDESFAIWLAAQTNLYTPRPASRGTVLLLSLYAWHSRYSPLPFGNSTIPPWTPDMKLLGATVRCEDWSRQIRVLCDLGPEGISDSWIPGITIEHYKIEPILTPEELLAEAQAMQNCVPSYSYSLALGECRLFSMTYKGLRIATIEVQYSPRSGTFDIVQMKGRFNTTCPDELHQIANAWITNYGRGMPSREPCPLPPADQRLRALLAPYAAQDAEKRKICTQTSLRQLFIGLSELQRITRRPASSLRPII